MSRDIVLRRPAAIVCVVAAGALAIWAGLLTWYAFGRDDFVRRFVVREAELRTDYDRKIGALRTRLDQVRSQRMVEQEGLEKRLGELAGRQAAIEARQRALVALAPPSRGTVTAGARIDPAVRWSTDARDERGPSGPSERGAKPVPVPAPEGFGLRMREPDAAEPPSGTAPRAEAAVPLGVRVAALERAVDEAAAVQAGAVAALLIRSRQESGRLRAVIAGLGLAPDKAREPVSTGGVGGPLVPLDPHAAARGEAIEGELDLLRRSLAELDALRRLGASLPLARPTSAEVEITSGFGYRLDPFNRSPALHTGVDLRADPGSPVSATGAGRVVAAEHAGGYGYMVEIDHGNRVTTRYAHLAAIEVSPGQTVAPGTVVGRVGSTGRSTGAHLHYETRVDGEPVDPRRFLRAETRLASAEGG